MTVAELIELLKKQPQDLPVAYAMHSEFCLMDERDIRIEDACQPRPDGWVARSRQDRPSQQYLMVGA